MVPDHPAMLRALLLAKQIAAKADPGFAGVSIPIPGEAIPLARAAGGYVPHGSPERTQNLMDWFGNSVLHDNGKPRTYYHGTSKDVDFKNFKIGRHGAWFTTDPESASQFAQENDSQNYKYEHGKYISTNTASRVIPAYLKAENPYRGSRMSNLDTGNYEGSPSDRWATNYKKAQSDWFDQLRARGYDSWVPDSEPGLAVMLTHPHQIKSAVGNIGTFDPTKPDINKAAGGEVDDTNNLNDMGLYSQAAKAASALKQAKGLPQDMLRAVSTAPGVKKDELNWSGVQDKFAGQSGITKDDLAQHFQDNMPNIKETTLGVNTPSADNDWSTTGGARYEDHTIPGGHNYREVLMHLPKNQKSFSDIAKEKGFTEPLTIQQRFIVQNADRGPEADYNSSHWDTPNVLAHLRMSDRYTPEGQKALHVEELQSDWGQHAREYGTLSPSEIADRRNAERAVVVSRAQVKQRLKELANAASIHDDQNHPDVQQAIQAYYDAKQAFIAADDHAERSQAMGRTVPEGPYINKTENWTDLGLKRALIEAARGDYDKLVYTPGEEQARRYNLSKHIARVDYEHDPRLNTHDIVAYDPHGVPIANHYDTKPEDLEQHLGKDIAQKILNGEGRLVESNERNDLDSRIDTKRLTGLDTKLGGEGMKGYYDKLLPERLLKLAREHDPEAQLGQHVVEKRNEGDHMTLPGLTITPRMREGILKRGFKAFADGGEVEPTAYADGGAVNPNVQNGAIDGDGDDKFPETGSIYSTPDSFAVGGMVMDPQKAIRRAMMTVRALHRADGGRDKPVNPRLAMGSNNPPSPIDPEKVSMPVEGLHPDLISQRSPKTKRPTEDQDARSLLVNLDAAKMHPTSYAHNVGLLKTYNQLRPDQIQGSDDETAEHFINHIKDNLLHIHDSMDPGFRERSKAWYVGANRFARKLAQRHSSPESVPPAVLAGLSPQKDWFQNASLAERLMDIHHAHQDTPYTKEMDMTANRIFGEGKFDDMLNRMRGKTYGQLDDPREKAAWVRLFDQTYHDPSYRELSPEGAIGEFIKTDKGENAKAAWGSLGEIKKGIMSIMGGGGRRLNSDLMGERHKIRNFYNNILDPHSPTEDVTADTHAVAGALMMPYGGNATPVAHNFKNSPEANFPAAKGSDLTGIQGTYPFYVEAMRRAAHERGAEPREMQSMTWEGARALFPDTFKTKENISAINNIWKNYQSGSITDKQAREQILEFAGHKNGVINDPSQAYARLGGMGGLSQEEKNSTYQRKLSSGDVHGESPGMEPGTGGAASPVYQGLEPSVVQIQRRHRETARAARSQFSEDTGLPQSYDAGVRGSRAAQLSAIIGAPVKAVHTPTQSASEAFSGAGITPLSMAELLPGTKAAAAFHAAISSAKAAQPTGGAVTVYDPSEYKNMRMFMTPDQKAGFALKGDDIVSVFNHPDSGHRNAATSMLQLALQQGGRKLDAYDTELPHFYSRNKFKVTSRMPWNEDYKPADWDHSAFKKYNNGRPDVVHMVFDPNHKGLYDEEEGGKTNDYDEALKLQDRGVRSAQGALSKLAAVSKALKIVTPKKPPRT